MNQAQTATQVTAIGYGAKLTLTSRDALALAFKTKAPEATIFDLPWTYVHWHKIGYRMDSGRFGTDDVKNFSQVVSAAEHEIINLGVDGACINGIKTDGYKLSHNSPITE